VAHRNGCELFILALIQLGQIGADCPSISNWPDVALFTMLSPLLLFSMIW
jgi:hypothetical protein